MALLYFVCVFQLDGTDYRHTYKLDAGNDCAAQTAVALKFTSESGGLLPISGVSGCHSLYVVVESTPLELRLQVHSSII